MGNAVQIVNPLLIFAYFGLFGIGRKLSVTDGLFVVAILAVSAVGVTLSVRSRRLQDAALFALTGLAFPLGVAIAKLTQEPWTPLVGGALMLLSFLGGAITGYRPSTRNQP